MRCIPDKTGTAIARRGQHLPAPEMLDFEYMHGGFDPDTDITAKRSQVTKIDFPL
jgi:hypothetical protein